MMRLRSLEPVYLVTLQIVNVEAMMSESERQIESEVPPDRYERSPDATASTALTVPVATFEWKPLPDVSYQMLLAESQLSYV